MEDDPIDLDIRYGTGHWDETEVYKLADEVATVVCHPDFAKSFGAEPRIHDALAAGFVPVLASQVEWRRLADHYELDISEPPVWLTADSSLIALQTIATGSGAALILESLSRPFVDRGELVSFAQ
jgi:LysR family glycine cleavage system transcriptional activator